MKRIPKAAYTLEFKLEALRRVRGGEPVRGIAREIGVPEQSIRNWVKAQAEGKLGSIEKGKPITPEQMEISRLRAEKCTAEDGDGDRKKSRRVLCEGVAVRYAFIEGHRGSYPLQALCAVLQVSDSGCAAWRESQGPTKWLSDNELLKLIRAVHGETRAAYGSPRIYLELKGRGVAVSKGRVERLMHEHGLRGRHRRRFKATTDSKHSLPVAPNRLDQNFATERPDQTWTADITYLATSEGWLYLAVVLDLYTRQIVGWAMRERMTKDLVIDALRMAWFRRRP